MNTLLVDQLREVVSHTGRAHGLACESSLRVAAMTLADTAPNEMTATRVIGTLGRDDAAAFEDMVSQIAQEYGLQLHTQLRGGSFAVRFSRATT